MRRLDFASNYGEARIILRERFVRFLPTNSATPMAPHLNSIPPLSDLEMVEFFQRLEILPNSDIEHARNVYEAVRKAAARRKPTASEVEKAPHDAHYRDGMAIGGGAHQYGFAALNPVPTFDELAERGWILVSWNRFSIPRRIGPELLGNEDECTEAFRAISGTRGENKFKTLHKGLPK